MEQQARKLKKLNRNSFEENASGNSFEIRQKKWKTRNKLLATSNANKITPIKLPLAKKIAIVSPIQNTPTKNNVASISNQRGTVISQSTSDQTVLTFKKPSQIIRFSSRIRQVLPSLGQMSSSSSASGQMLRALNQKTLVHQPTQTVRAKPIVLKRNRAPVVSNTCLQSSSSSKTSTPKPTLTKQKVMNNSRKLGDSNRNIKNVKPSLELPKVSPVPHHERKTIRIGISPALSALERKQNQQQKLKMCKKIKNHNSQGGSKRADPRLARASEDSNIPSSTQSNAEPIVTDLITMSRNCKNVKNLDDMSINIGALASLGDATAIDKLIRDQCFVIVLDTNVLMHKQEFVDALKDTPLKGCGPPVLYIPWIILNELDGLKSSSSKNRTEATQAIKYLHNMFTSKHPRFLGQKCRISSENIQTYGDSNDDKLLSCCAILTQKVSKDKLILLSNDICLCTKAWMCGVTAYTTEQLFTKLKPDVCFLLEKDCAMNLPNKEDSMIIDNLTKPPTTEKLNVDIIICEAKQILKEILEPFLDESMDHAFGDMKKTFLKPPPATLLDILGYYEKYWVSVFSIVFNKDVKKYFDTLMELFNSKQGDFSDVDDAFAALIAIENICKAVALEKPTIDRQIYTISQLTDACKALTTKPGDDVLMGGKRKSEITLSVLTHLWSLMEYFCGMMMDFTELPHNFEYTKPAKMPPLSEFERVLSNFFPALQKIKLRMSKVIDITTATEQAEHEEDYKSLYDSLLQFVPSLKIKAVPPPAEEFTIQCLKHFMLDQEYRERLKIGFRQLKIYQKKLVDVIHLPIWEP